MKRIKKIASLLLAVVMVLGMTMTTFAQEQQEQQNPPISAGQYKLALNASTNHTYKIYQVLTGTVSADGKTLSDMGVGANVKSDYNNVDAIIAKLKDTEKSKDDNIVFLEGAALGDAALELIKADTPYVTYTRPNNEESEADKKLPVLKKEFILPGGYYVITDSFVNAEGNEDTVSRTMVYLVEDVTVTPKTTSVTPDKKIKEDDTGKDSNEASIGDTITYQLSGSIPDMTGYKKFKYVLVDTASKGLIQQVKVGDKKIGGIGTKNDAGLVTPDTDSPKVEYEVTAVTRNADGTTTIRLAVKNAIQYADKFQENPLKWFYVEIDAQLTAEAEVVKIPNTNKVKIDFSNNPNEDYDGETDDFGPDEPKGETPDVIVETYTTSLTLTKVDGKDATKKLQGAVFMLEGDAVKVGYVTGYEYVLKSTVSEYTGDDWYKLKDNTYTKTAPKQDGENSAYESITDIYALVPVAKPNVSFVKKAEVTDYTGQTWYKVIVDGKEVYTQEKPEGTAEEYVLINNTPTGMEAQAVTGEDGQIEFTGLGAGKYTLTEVKAPEGYNKITNKIVFTVTWNKDEGFKVVDLHEVDEKGNIVVDSNNTTYVISVAPENPDDTTNPGKGTTLSSTIVNNNGSQLPSTGGIGTTIFYIVGGILVIGAGILLVAKKRMGSK